MSSTSKFLSVALEIRLQIYRSLLLPGLFWQRRRPFGCADIHSARFGFPIDLLLVNKQISTEAKAVFYDENIWEIKPSYHGPYERRDRVDPDHILEFSPKRYHFCKFDIVFCVNDSNAFGAPDFVPFMISEAKRITTVIAKMPRVHSIAISWTGYRGVLEATKPILGPLKNLPKDCTITTGRFSCAAGDTDLKSREEFVSYIEELLGIECAALPELSLVGTRIQRYTRRIQAGKASEIFTFPPARW